MLDTNGDTIESRASKGLRKDTSKDRGGSRGASGRRKESSRSGKRDSSPKGFGSSINYQSNDVDGE